MLLSVFFLSDFVGEFHTEDTALEQDRSGSTTYGVAERRLISATVHTTAGEHTTVITARTCLSAAGIVQVGLQQ